MTRVDRKDGQNVSERGIALFMTIATLLLVTAIAAGLLLMTNTETTISANFRDEQTAFFSAKAGIEELRDRMRAAAPNSLKASLPTNLPGQANGVLYVTNPLSGETVAPWNTTGSNYPDDEICKEIASFANCSGSPPVPGGSPWYTTTSASSSYAPASPIPQLTWKWARITVKTNKTSSGTSTTDTVNGNTSDNNSRVCFNGSNEVTTTQSSCGVIGAKQVYVITALGITPSGSRRMVQAEATPTGLPTLPGALIFDGSTPVYGAPSSNALSVSGNDAAQGPNSGTGCAPAINEPAVGAYDNPATTTLSGDIPRPDLYTGTGGSPSVSNVHSLLGALNTVAGLRSLVTSVVSAATIADPTNIYSGNASSLINPGTNSAPVINVVTGDLTLGGGFTGAGILLVEGNLTMQGNPAYNGLILVIGKGVLNKNGGGNGVVNGSILVANLYDSSGNPISSGPPGVPTINWNGGGNATIQYDSCWVNNVSQFPYRIVAVREMMY
jgi:hypothetical protein